MKRLKLVIVLLVCLSMILSLTACSKSADNGATADTSFSWWIFAGADSIYYTDYKENPVVKYMESKSWGSDKAKIDLDFLIPVAGAEKDNCVTLISTGEYPDIMDMSVYPGTISELYNDGIALDITEYVEKYMPNYLAYLDAHPDLKATATNVVDGEKKYLGIYGYGDDPEDMWGGYMYRRDWIVKYGKNPTDGSTFSGAYTETKEDGTANVDTWADNVVFPSGGSDPVYISDWEWMMKIFQTAIEDQQITDGYGMSLYYPGYMETGDLVCAFGGTKTGWYVDPEGTIGYGATGDNFRTYLQCMSTWYQNGWIDTAFPEHATDIFYQIDDTKMRQGKVGLWYGLVSDLGGKLDNGEGYLDGIVVFAASQPINDSYGTAAQQNVQPYCMYQSSLEGVANIITDKAKDKDLPTLFTMLDYFYSEEGSLLRTLGLNKEQYEESQDEFYTRYKLTEGAYQQNDDGTYTKTDIVLSDKSLIAAVTGIRLLGLTRSKDIVSGNTEIMQHNIDQWTKYTCSGALNGSFESQLTVENSKNVSKVTTNTREFLSKNVPSFIQGGKDPYNDDDWNAYLKAMGKYNADSVTQMYQAIYDSLN